MTDKTVTTAFNQPLDAVSIPGSLKVNQLVTVIDLPQEEFFVINSFESGVQNSFGDQYVAWLYDVEGRFHQTFPVPVSRLRPIQAN